MHPADPLGPCLATYQSPPLRRQRWLVIGLVVGSLVSCLGLGLGLLFAYSGQTRFGPAAAFKWSQPWFVFGFGLAAVVLLLGVRAALLVQRKVYLHARGMRLVGYPAWKVFSGRTIYWNQLQGVSYRAVRTRSGKKPVFSEIALYPSKGRPLRLVGSEKAPARLGGLPELSELASRLKARLYPRLQPAFRQNFTKGAWLWFGPVSIHASALRLTRFGPFNRVVPWKQVRQMTVRSGSLVVELSNSAGKTTRCSYPVQSVPNVELLLQLVDEGVQI